MPAKSALLLLLGWQLMACSLRPGASNAGAGSDVVRPLWHDQSAAVSTDTLPCVNVVALLIGIGQYAPANGWESLSSQNDVSLMRAALRKRGVTPDHIHTLTDAQATKAGIEHALKTLIETLEPGNVVIVLYAGHARQLSDDSGDEADGYDEAIVPYDAPPTSQNQPAGYLRDDDLNQYLAQIRAALGPTGSLWLLFDSCHSQTLNRGQSASGSLAQRTRGGLAPLGKPARWRPARTNANPAGSDWYETAPTRGHLSPYVLFSATTDAGPTIEITDASGRSCGPLTRAVSETWDNVHAGETYLALFQRVAIAMARYAPYQQPGLEGDTDTPAPGCGLVAAGTGFGFSTTGEPLRVAWPTDDAQLTNRLADLSFVQMADQHPDLRIDHRHRGYRIWTTDNRQPLTEADVSMAVCVERVRQYFARNVLLQLHQTNPAYGVRATLQRVAVKTDQRRTVVTDTLPNLTATGLSVFSTAPNERAVLTLTNTGPKSAYLTVVDLQPDGTLHVLLPGEGQPASAYHLLPGQSLRRLIRLTEPLGAEVYKILLTPTPINLRTVLQTRGDAPVQHPYELLFQRTYTTRGMPMTLPLPLSDQTGATAEMAFWVEK